MGRARRSTSARAAAASSDTRTVWQTGYRGIGRSGSPTAGRGSTRRSARRAEHPQKKTLVGQAVAFEIATSWMSGFTSYEVHRSFGEGPLRTTGLRMTERSNISRLPRPRARMGLRSGHLLGGLQGFPPLPLLGRRAGRGPRSLALRARQTPLDVQQPECGPPSGAQLPTRAVSMKRSTKNQSRQGWISNRQVACSLCVLVGLW
jgi:hypothetical protein